jgi:hypothetical protein
MTFDKTLPFTFQKMTLLLLGHCQAHPSSESKDGKIKFIFLLRNTIALIQSLDQGII